MTFQRNNLFESTREAYGDELCRLGKIYENFFVVDADLSQSTQTYKFAREFPERFVNVGCAEQNLVSVAAGIAACGNTVFVSTYSIFLMRAWEQIRNGVAINQLPVKLVVSHSGLTNAADGASHQSMEDIAIMRAIPTMNVYIPVDSNQTKKLIESELMRKGPAYIRLNREKTPVLTDSTIPYAESSIQFIEGHDIVIIACGTMVHQACLAAIELNCKGIFPSIFGIQTIKPLDISSLMPAITKAKLILTIEEHSIVGGMGSAIAEGLSQISHPPHIIMGILDKFGESGSYCELLDLFEINSTAIVNKVLQNYNI